MHVKQVRPKFLDLSKIRLPITAKVSLLHRLSGILLFLSIPFFIYLLQLSLSSEQGYQQAAAIVDGILVKLFLFVLLWALMHHLLAGIRFLLIDADIGVNIEAARTSAKQVIIAGVVSAVILGLIIL
jgi:succinate dehydrogenase / fumarate reductase cytochrome b subunit